jgi:hypothetical protein
MTQGLWDVYAIAATCVSPCDGTGMTVRGQEMLSMPSASDAFMSLTWIQSSQYEYRGSPAQRTAWEAYLKACRDIDRALKSTVFEFFHRIDRKCRICVGQKWRWGAVTGDSKATFVSQVNPYLLFLETRKFERSGNEVRLRLVAYFYAGRK